MAETVKKRWITVEVTVEMLKEGRSSDCYSCPLALALRAATGLYWHVMPTNARIEVLWGRKPIWTFPPEVCRFVSAVDHLDSRDDVSPISFRLPARFADTERWAALGAGIGDYGGE